MKKRSVFLLFLFTATVSLPPRAYAIDIPATAEPSRAQEQLAPPAAPALPEGAGPAGSAGIVEAPEGAKEATFQLVSVTIEGMTVYKEDEIASLYKPLVGKTINLVEVYALADLLTAKYRNDGYILSQVVIPPQTIEGGKITLQAVEGFVDRIIVQSQSPADAALLAPYNWIVRDSKPLNAKALERYILLLNDLPGFAAKSALSPSPQTPGASNLTLMLMHKPYDGSVQMDNRGSLYMGPWQVNASTKFNNPFGVYDSFTIQAATTPTSHPRRELDYVGFRFTRPLGHNGLVMNASGSVTSTAPGYTLKQFDIDGSSHAYGIGVTYPFLRSREENFSGTFKFDYLDTTRSDNLGGGEIEDRLRVLRLGGLYQFPDRFRGSNAVSAEASQGVNIFNTKLQGSANMTRAAGNPLFFKVTADVARLQRLTEMFDLSTTFSGQWSADTLLASEEFGVGGAGYGSAYDSSEITGRHGVAARLELRANNPVATALQKLQAYGFYDVGQVWDPRNAVRRDRIRSLASAGLGLRFAVNDTFSGSCEVAAPLTRKIETEQDKNPRVFAALTARF